MPSSPLLLSQPQAFGILTIYCLVYVLPLHASKNTRPSATRSRDSPATIRARIRAVSFSTAACSVVTLILLWSQPAAWADGAPNAAGAQAALHLMGYWPLGFVGAMQALLLTVVLFAAPLYEMFIIDQKWLQWRSFNPIRELMSSWPAWRNLVAGPVTEECLFRSAAVPLLLLAGTSLTNIISLSPVVFGVAHFHHFYEFRVMSPGVPLLAAIAQSLLQFAYTTLFGAYATFLFLRTGSLLAIILVHTFCNCMGLPRFWGHLEPIWITPQKLNSTSRWLWTAPYYGLLIGGVLIWWRALLPLTESSTALAAF